MSISMNTAPNTCVLQMLATHLVDGRGGLLRGRAAGAQRACSGRAEGIPRGVQVACRWRAGGVQVAAHERVAEEVLLEE